MAYVPLPAARVPSNAMLPFDKLSDTIGSNREFQRQNAMDAYRRERDKVSDQRAAAAETRAVESHGWERESQRHQKRQRALEAASGIAQMIMDSPAEMQAQRYQQFRQAIPDFDADMAAAGFDPNNWQTTLPAIVAKARGYQDPLDRQSKEADIAYKQAQTGKLNRAGGGFDSVKDRANVEEGLRKEYAGLAKPYFEVRDAYTRVESSAKDPSAAGDLALIFNYMKMLDPGSVVREGEFATAQNAAGVPDQVRNMFNRLLNGERMNPDQRTDFVSRARQLYQGQERQYQGIQRQYRGISERVGADPRNTIIDFGRPPDVDALNAARQAIERGAPRDAVIKRLQENGIDPSGL